MTTPLICIATHPFCMPCPAGGCHQNDHVAYDINGLIDMLRDTHTQKQVILPRRRRRVGGTGDLDL